jgi:thioredoxin 1
MVVAIDDKNFETEVLKSTIPVLMDFTAAWCGPCKMIAPIIEELSVQYAGKLKVCKIDIDQAPQTATRYAIMSIPTMAIVKNGQVVDQLVGAVPKQNIVNIIQKHVS